MTKFLFWGYFATGSKYIDRLNYDPNFKLFFLGDYIDRGKKSLEVILTVLALKEKYPDKVMVLRGNHEIHGVNSTYGFKAEIALNSNFSRELDFVHQAFNNIFYILPMVAFTSNGGMLVHGGPPISTKEAETLNDLLVERELLWTDLGQKGEKSTRGGGVGIVSQEMINHLSRLGIKYIVRGHQLVLNKEAAQFNDPTVLPKVRAYTISSTGAESVDAFSDYAKCVPFYGELDLKLSEDPIQIQFKNI